MHVVYSWCMFMCLHIIHAHCMSLLVHVEASTSVFFALFFEKGLALNLELTRSAALLQESS